MLMTAATSVNMICQSFLIKAFTLWMHSSVHKIDVQPGWLLCITLVLSTLKHSTHSHTPFVDSCCACSILPQISSNEFPQVDSLYPQKVHYSVVPWWYNHQVQHPYVLLISVTQFNDCMLHATCHPMCTRGVTCQHLFVVFILWFIFIY